MKRLRLRRSESGQTMAEYGVILAVITPGIVVVLLLMSDALAERLETVAGFLF